MALSAVLIICASDTLVSLLVPVGKQLQEKGVTVKYATLMYTREKAEFALANMINPQHYEGVVRPHIGWLSRFSMIVIGNDWGDEIKSIIYMSKAIGLASVCIQESVIDFGGVKKRLSHATHVILQGVVSQHMLKRSDNVYICGNPRYDLLTYRELPSHFNVFVNVNFTYGVQENIRHEWVISVLGACNKANINVTLVQHPRDTSDLSIYNVPYLSSNSSKIHNLLGASSLVITRFSSLIHESICIGRPVIYFDPNKEDMYYDFTPDGVVLSYAFEPDDIFPLLVKYQTNFPQLADFDTYLMGHLSFQGGAANSCAERILEINNLECVAKRRVFNLVNFIYYQVRSLLKDVWRLFGFAI